MITSVDTNVFLNILLVNERFYGNSVPAWIPQRPTDC